LTAIQARSILENVQEAGYYRYIAESVKNSDMNQLRQMADQWKTKKNADVLVLGTAKDGKANLLVALSDEAVQGGLDAKELIRAIAPFIQGGGGGRANMAQAGGKDPAGLSKALAEVSEYLKEKK
jgi:alanyl-tRNA synthetase